MIRRRTGGRGGVWAMVILTAAALTPAALAEPLPRLNAEELRAELDRAFSEAKAPQRTVVTLKVVDLETGQTLYDRGGGWLMTPASNLKIYTAAAALDLLRSPDGVKWGQWAVVPGEAFATGPDVIGREVLLRNAHHPMYTNGDLAAFADGVARSHQQTGVTAIRVEDPPAWSEVPLKGPGWMWDDDPDDYNMSITSFMMDFNVLTVRVAVEDGEVVAALDPAAGYPPIVNTATVATGGEEATLTVTRNDFEHPILISGTLPADAQPRTVRLTMHDPRRWVVAVMEQMLRDRGVPLYDDAPPTPERPVHDGRVRLGLHSWAWEIAPAVRHFNRESENAIGEMLLLTLGDRFHDDEKTGWPQGAEVITRWLIDTAGLEQGSFRLVDGSGLSRYNLINADSSVKLLAFMKGHDAFDVFFDSLPDYEIDLKGIALDGATAALPGDDLPARLDDDEPVLFDGTGIAATRVFAKPGGMSGVSTISGYLVTLDGRWLAFSYLANGIIGPANDVRTLRSEVWRALVRYQPE